MKIIKDIDEIGIRKETILNRITFREGVRKFYGFKEGIKSKSEIVYSQEREAPGGKLKKCREEVKSGQRTRIRRTK